LEVGGTSYVYSVRDSSRGQLFKHLMGGQDD
jgi:hypothetical protein